MDNETTTPEAQTLVVLHEYEQPSIKEQVAQAAVALAITTVGTVLLVAGASAVGAVAGKLADIKVKRQEKKDAAAKDHLKAV